MKNSKVLGIDFGKNHVGLALSDEARQIVFGKGVIRNYGSLKNLGAKLKELILKEGVTEIVMGLPLAEDGSDTDQSKRIRDIGKKLTEFLPENIVFNFWDESFTSARADTLLDKFGLKVHRYKETQDELAAVLILKDYLKIY